MVRAGLLLDMQSSSQERRRNGAPEGWRKTARRHHPNPAEADRRWRGERSKPVRLGVRDHHTRSLCAESPAQTEQWCCWLCRRRIIFRSKEIPWCLKGVADVDMLERRRSFFLDSCG